jgi:hypothetical protein
MEKTGPNSLNFNFIYLLLLIFLKSSDFDDKFQQVSKNINGLLLLLFPTFILVYSQIWLSFFLNDSPL